MEQIYNARRERLRQYMHDECESKQVALAERVGKSTATVTRWFNEKNRKRIGEELAREIEEKLGKPPYWLDGLMDSPRWPFPGIPAERIKSLTPDQKAALERTLLSALDMVDPPHDAKKNRVAL